MCDKYTGISDVIIVISMVFACKQNCSFMFLFFQDTDLKVVNCTACNKNIVTKRGKFCRHPDLNTIICKVGSQ